MGMRGPGAGTRMDRTPTRRSRKPAGMSENGQSIETLLAQGGHYIDPRTGAIVPPIHPSTTYARDERYELIGYGYSRSGNPTCAQVEEVLAKLEGAEDALVFASGLAGIATFFDTVRSGEHVVAPRVMYHGAADWLRRLAGRRGVGVTFFDAGRPRCRGQRGRQGRRRRQKRRGRWRPRSAPVRPRWSGSRRRSIRPGT